MSRYLLTGTAGFIASNVARMLLERGDEVTGIDDLNESTDPRLKQRRLDAIPSGGFRFLRADIRDRTVVRQVFDEHGPFDAVLHLAARAGVRASVEDPWLYLDTNVAGTLNLLDACVRVGVSKFVYASSSSVYGADAPAPCPETARIDRPLSPYAASKVAGEALCSAYHGLHGMDVSVLRYFTVYGPAGRPDMAPFRFVQWIVEGRPLHLFGDGSQTRDLTYIDDIASGTIAALKPLGYEPFNLGCDQPVRVNDMIGWIEEFAGRPAQIVHEPVHAADVRDTWAQNEKAARLLAWRPQTSAREGVRKLVEWYLDNREWAADIRTS